MRRAGRADTPLSLAFDQLFQGLRKRDPELAERMKVVLRRLNLLPAGATSRYAVDLTTGSAPKSSPPPKADSPFHDYFHKFTRAPNDKALEAFVAQAEVECAIFEGGDKDSSHGNIPARVRAALRVADESEDEQAAMDRVIEWYRGDPPELAALKEGDPRLAEWIRTVRRKRRRDEETGEPFRGWDGWDDQERTAQVRRLWDQGVGRDKAAERLQISPRTISAYWPGRQPRRAA